MKKKFRQFIARLWANHGYGISECYHDIRESVFDAMDESTGAAETIRFLQAENDEITRENSALKTLLTEQMRETERYQALAERYRCGARKLHHGATRYRKNQRCDAIARELYAQNVKTEHGQLKSAALN